MKDDSDESENQGFVPNQIRIDSQSVMEEEGVLNEKNRNFEPRYIVGEGVIRKEPPECYIHSEQIPVKAKTNIIKKVNSLAQNMPTVYEVYTNEAKYSLIYSRMKEPFGRGIRCSFQNEIKLKCYENSGQQNFRVLREWKSFPLQQILKSNNELIFDSRFEGGNLLCCFRNKTQINTYQLFMQNDTNTYGFNQWFNFSIRNAKPNILYTFRIANYKKSYSFFTKGMQPLIFSLKRAQKTGNGWYRDGINISYFNSNFKEIDVGNFYTLEFQLSFQYAEDYITLSPHSPYSYSKLIRSLQIFEREAISNGLNWKMKSIAESLAGNQVPYVTISNTSNSLSKPCLIILARQHSGQTWSSFLAQNLMQQLVQLKSQASKWMLQNFDICIFPMINVDGVIYGNFRCDLAGFDLNRCWKNPLSSINPQIYYIKQEISKLSDSQGISLCIDLHTHSKSFGAFAYCCINTQKCRALPLIISKLTPIFRYPACTFGITLQKQHTARATVYGLTSNINILTIQLSTCGFINKKRRMLCPFNPGHVSNIAKAIINAFWSQKNKKREVDFQDPYFESEDQWIQIYDEVDEDDDDQPVSGSDSQPQIDQIQVSIKMQKIFPSNFIQDIMINHDKKAIKKLKKVKKHRNENSKIMSLDEKNLFKKRNIRMTKESSIAQTKNSVFFSAESAEISNDLPFDISSNKQTAVRSNNRQPLYQKSKKLPVQKSSKLQERSVKPLNLIQFSLKKLPLFPPQKITNFYNSNHLILQDCCPVVQGISFGKKQYNRFDKTFSTYEAMCRPRARTNAKKIGFERQKFKLQEQLPYLCVMSQKKKQLQVQKMKKNLSNKSEETPHNDIRTFHNSILNGHRPQNPIIVQKFRQKHHKQTNLLSKIGLDHFTRYGTSSNSQKN